MPLNPLKTVQVVCVLLNPGELQFRWFNATGESAVTQFKWFQ